MLVLWAITFVLLIAVTGVVLKPVRTSRFELKRRSDNGDTHASAELERQKALPLIAALQRVVISMLLVFYALLSIVAYGWLSGVIIALLGAVLYERLAQIKIISQKSTALLARYEDTLLRFIENHATFFRLLPKTVPGPGLTFHSREELVHLVHQSAFLTDDEKKRVTGTLKFNTRTIDEVMTTRDHIESVNASELLGPLVLNDLHKTGHSQLPVTEGDIDHIVGILHLKELMVVNTKRSLTAAKAMDPSVSYIRSDQSLATALAVFLRNTPIPSHCS